MAAPGTNSRQSELGDFLRSRRQKLTPKVVGLSAGRRRRTPGLRREEVAELAGIGVDWYIRLEQGRSVSPSTATIDALARALRLTKAEHRHLTELTQNADRRPFVRETVPPAIRRTVEQLNSPDGVGTFSPGMRLRKKSLRSAGWRRPIATACCRC
jgi:transcriptional regulator with XRE-family HTH domain